MDQNGERKEEKNEKKKTVEKRKEILGNTTLTLVLINIHVCR
jgi:hypothetical protein